MLGYPLGWMIAAGLFFALILFVMMSSIVIRCHLKREGDDDRVELRVRALFGLIHYYWTVPNLRLKASELEVKREMKKEDLAGFDSSSSTQQVDAETVMSNYRKFQSLLQQTGNLMGWARRTLGHVRLTEWQWRTAVGTGDAMWTAMTTGMIWSAKTTTIGLVSQLVRLSADPELAVVPMYNRMYFATEGRFTARISIGYAMIAGIRLIFRLRKAKVKGIRSGWIGWQRILLRT